jgi:AAA family ATP:ADP antiporter
MLGGGILRRVATTLYGDIPPEVAERAGIFSALLCFVVGVYWLMRSLKDSVFATIVGLEYQPQAKILSLVVVTGVLFIYNKVVDLAPRHHLFSIVCGAYSVIFVGTALCLMSPTIGLNGPDGTPLKASPDRLLGWIHYFAIESYGSLAVSLFWQYTNSQVNLKDAKAQYGIITAGGQIGAITGCSLVVGSKRFGVPQLYALGGVLTLVAPCIVLYYHKHYVVADDGAHAARSEKLLAAAEEAEDEGDRCRRSDASASSQGKRGDALGAGAPGPAAAGKTGDKPVTPGLFEGLRLLFKHPYVMGIFAVSALFEIIATILDYQMKVLGKASHHSTADFAAFMGFFGQAANSVSLVFSLLGTSFVIRTFGVRITLMLFPAMLIVAVRVVYSAPSMWVLFGVMVSIKGLAYALNNPSKEVRRRMQHASAGSSERDCAALVAHPLIRTSPRGTSPLHTLHRALF